MYLAGSTTTVDCGENALDSTETLTGTFMVAAGTTSDIVNVPEAGDSCAPLRLDVSGSVATAQSGQSCTSMQGTAPNTVTIVTTINSYSGTLDTAGTKVTFQGQAAGMVTGAVTTTCTATTTGSAMKVAARTASDGQYPPDAALLHMLPREAR